jgi:hypothetical protein
LTWLEVDCALPWSLQLWWAGSVGDRGGHEFLVGETPMLRVKPRDPRTGDLQEVDSVTLVWLRDAEGADVLTDEEFAEPALIGDSWTYALTEPLDAGRYDLLV